MTSLTKIALWRHDLRSISHLRLFVKPTPGPQNFKNKYSYITKFASPPPCKKTVILWWGRLKKVVKYKHIIRHHVISFCMEKWNALLMVTVLTISHFERYSLMKNKLGVISSSQYFFFRIPKRINQSLS